MTNTLVTPSWVTNASAMRFMNSVKGIANFNRSYDGQYEQGGAKVGYTVQARLPQRFLVSDGQNYSPQDLFDQTVPISLTNQKHVDFQWSSASGTMEVDEVQNRYIYPAADALASAADVMGMAAVYRDVYNMVGVPGTTPSTTLQYLTAVQKIVDLAGPDEGYKAVLDTLAMATIANTTSALFNPPRDASKNYKTGMLAAEQLGIDEWYRDQNIPRHTTGTFTASTPVINGAGQTGSTLATNGWAAGASSLKRGDIITIAGVFFVNPLSYVSTGRLAQFTVTADTSDAAGAMATLPISPSIITSGALQTVNASPATGAAITVWSANPVGGTLATTVSPQSLVFHPNFAVFVMADLVKPNAGAQATVKRSRDYGISIRYVEQFLIGTDVNANRLDILIGAAPLQPRLATRVVG